MLLSESELHAEATAAIGAKEQSGGPGSTARVSSEPRARGYAATGCGSVDLPPSMSPRT